MQSSKKGLAASRFADDAGEDKNGEASAESETPTTEDDEPDHSSAAMSAVRKFQ